MVKKGSFAKVFLSLDETSSGSPMVHPIPEIKAVVGRSVHIICPASGYPLDKIAWSKGFHPRATHYI